MSDNIRLYSNLQDLLIPEIADSTNLKNLILMGQASDLFTMGGGKIGIDRTSTFPMPYNFVSEQIPTVKFTGSFSDACILSAKNIWKDPRKKVVFWSGGIDSTCLLVALMQTNTDWKNKLKIVTSTATEYIWFKDNFLMGADFIFSDNKGSIFNENLYSGEYQILNGELSDQLWGLGRDKYQCFDIKDQPYTKLFDYAKLTSKLNPSDFTATINYVEEFISKSNYEIKTVADFRFWWIFTHFWTGVKYRMPVRVGALDAINNFVSFFDTPEFQSWAMENRDLKIKDTWETYKFPAKDFIFNFTNDPIYQRKAVKWGSPIPNPNRELVLLTNNQLIEKTDISSLRLVLTKCLSITN